MTSTEVTAPHFAFDNSYARLPEHFYARIDPTPVAAPELLKLNDALAEELGLSPAALRTPEGLAVLAGNTVPETSTPLAAAYAGHQFGNFVPKLGDGRAVLIGELIDRSGARRDVQLKGAGPTPFSRRGDGRSAMAPVLREYVVSEAMAALGIPTTRALAAVSTGESVYRELELPGAVLTRIASSHIRVGTFQFFAARRDTDALNALADHVIARHYPNAAKADNPYLALLEGIIERQAHLISQWLLVGFIHGVMNTDNMSIAGETIDYGPCAFMDFYHPHTVYSSIDRGGRYAFVNQPPIAAWNLGQLAGAMLPLFDADEDKAVEQAKGVAQTFRPKFEEAYTEGLMRKIGISSPQTGDLDLIQDLLDRMSANKADFALTFRKLSDIAIPGSRATEPVRDLFDDPEAFDAWAPKWRERLKDDDRSTEERRTDMNSVNPAIIPRNHLVEEALNAAVFNHDLGPFNTLHDALSNPFRNRPDDDRLTQPPKPDEVVHATFCGT